MNPAGDQLRDYDELQGTLLPTASPVEPSAPFESDLPTAQLIATSRSSSQQPRYQTIEEAPFIPPEPSDERYRNEGKQTLPRAQQKGRMAAYEERINVMRHNQTVHAYNNQADLDVDRANEAARLENYRERQFVNPTIITAPFEKPSIESPNTKKRDEEEAYFPSAGKKGGYKVKEYDMDNYDDAGYSYDISEYKSDYDWELL